MVKILSNTVISYLEESINAWVSNNNVKVIDYKYSTAIFDEEILHCVLIVYESVDAKL